jgi:hypothetical protein
MRLVRGWSVLDDDCPRNDLFVILCQWLQTNSRRFKEVSGSAVTADVMDRFSNAGKQAEAAAAFGLGLSHGKSARKEPSRFLHLSSTAITAKTLIQTLYYRDFDDCLINMMWYLEKDKDVRQSQSGCARLWRNGCGAV